MVTQSFTHFPQMGEADLKEFNLCLCCLTLVQGETREELVCSLKTISAFKCHIEMLFLRDN